MRLPAEDCSLCPRLAEFRAQNRVCEPHWHNAPVPSFGPVDAAVLVVGLAPGLRGANASGRPFTGDFAGGLLYRTIEKFGFSSGNYNARADDGLKLNNLRITNAVRCAPPANKPSGPEIRACLPYLADEIASMENLLAIVALGRIAHDAVLSAYQEKKSAWPFGHGAVHRIPGKPVLTDSYHCSRYNTNTGRLSPEMFEAVFAQLGALLEA